MPKSKSTSGSGSYESGSGSYETKSGSYESSSGSGSTESSSGSGSTETSSGSYESSSYYNEPTSGSTEKSSSFATQTKSSGPRRPCNLKKPCPALNGRRCLRCCPPPCPPKPPLYCAGPPCFDCCQRIRPGCKNQCNNYISKCRRPCMHPYHPPPPCPLPDICCDSREMRQYRVCKAELERLRNEKWRQEERQAILEEKKQQKWMEEQYQSQVRQWEKANIQCAKDRETREQLLEQIRCQRKEVKRLREEAKAWRRQKYKLMMEEAQAEEDLWAKQFCQREAELRVHQEQLKIAQEDKWLEAQTRPHESENMMMPELEEMRRMFAPVNRGPNETFEYYLVEPRPTPAELRKSAEMKMAALMGLRNENGMHFDCSDKCKKRTTVSVSMGPRCLNGECCKVITEPGAACCLPEFDQNCSKVPNVPVPECLQSLMKTLSYRVSQIDSPLLRMKSFGPGPHFNGSRLYGTIVVPKGQHLAPLYTDRFCVTY